MARKVFVEVFAVFDTLGYVHPLKLKWEDGRTFEVDRVLEVCPAASLKVGGKGIRYTCSIMGRQTYLFLDKDRWFVEGRQ